MHLIKGNDTLSMETNPTNLILLPSKKGSTLKGNNLHPRSKLFPLRVDPSYGANYFPPWSKLFPFRVDPFPERDWRTIKQTCFDKLSILFP